jgi:trehalose 6-phosphate phosphatase
MRYATRNSQTLNPLAETRVESVVALRPRGLFTDLDGTLSRIAPTPEAAVLLPGIRPLLRQASACFTVVAVSGRAALDARRMVGLDEITYIGNHGLERIDPQPDGEPALIIAPDALPYAASIRAVLAEVERVVAPQHPGLRSEPKGVTGSVHVRGTAEPAAAEAAVLAVAEPLAAAHNLRVTRGKLVVELRPPLHSDKGTSVAALIRERGLRVAIYLGDDRTDIDAFRALRRLTAEGVCVGIAVAVLHSEAPSDLAQEADLTLPSIDAVPAFLRHLVRRCMKYDATHL